VQARAVRRGEKALLDVLSSKRGVALGARLRLEDELVLGEVRGAGERDVDAGDDFQQQGDGFQVDPPAVMVVQ